MSEEDEGLGLWTPTLILIGLGTLNLTIWAFDYMTFTRRTMTIAHLFFIGAFFLGIGSEQLRQHNKKRREESSNE